MKNYVHLTCLFLLGLLVKNSLLGAIKAIELDAQGNEMSRANEYLFDICSSDNVSDILIVEDSFRNSEDERAKFCIILENAIGYTPTLMALFKENSFMSKVLIEHGSLDHIFKNFSQKYLAEIADHIIDEYKGKRFEFWEKQIEVGGARKYMTIMTVAEKLKLARFKQGEDLKFIY